MIESTPAGGGPWRFVLVAGLAAGAAVAGGWAVGKYRAARTDPPPAGATHPPAAPPAAPDRRGEVLFAVHCVACHGPDGRGDGPVAAELRPPPRDFAARPWRFEVTRESIRRVVEGGIPGSRMPAFRTALPAADTDAVAEYTFRLATSRPPVPYEPTPEEKLLRDAEFTDLRGTAPPRLTVTDAAGRDVTLAELKGKLVLLHFWRTNCLPCLKEMPALKGLEAEFGGRGLVVLHVCTDAEDVAEAQELAGKAAPGVRVAADLTGLGANRFEVQATPAVWLIAPDGTAVGRADGARDWSAPALRHLVGHWLPTAAP